MISSFLRLFLVASVVLEMSTAFTWTKIHTSRPLMTTTGLITTKQRILLSTATDYESAVATASEEREQVQAQEPQQPLSVVKSDLVHLLTTMHGTADDFRRVEAAVNRLEADYQPIQTLDFFNLCQAGQWQLLFSTQHASSSSSSMVNPQQFRLRALTQRITPDGHDGTWHTEAVWDLAPASDARFLCSGTFTIQHDYQITQGARCALHCRDDQNVLKLAKGSAVPDDVPTLVALLHRSMPKELIDASGHSADTTYLDDTVRIVRYTGGRMEGVRDIFIRTDNWADSMGNNASSKAKNRATEDGDEDASDALF